MDNRTLGIVLLIIGVVGLTVVFSMPGQQILGALVFGMFTGLGISNLITGDI